MRQNKKHGTREYGTRKESKRVVFLRSENIILRPFNKKTDLESMTRWINDPDVRQYLIVYRPTMLEHEEAWLDRCAKNEDNNIILAIETADGIYIGNMGLHNINWKDRTAMTGSFIGEEKFRNKGYGTEAKMLLLDYAFNTLNLHKIYSAAFAFNERSVNYSKHCGYKVEGRRREQFFKNGAYCDEIMLGVLKDEWLAARKEWLAKKNKVRGQKSRQKK